MKHVAASPTFSCSATISSTIERAIRCSRVVLQQGARKRGVVCWLSFLLASGNVSHPDQLIDLSKSSIFPVDR